MKLRILSDIHGNIQPVIKNYYQKDNYDLLIQLGDFGFRDTYKHLDKFDPAILRILPGNHDCLDDKTEICTLNGWKTIYELHNDDLVVSLNSREESEWVHINEIIKKQYTGDMSSFQGKHIDFKVTPNHRFLWHKYNRYGNVEIPRIDHLQDIPKNKQVCLFNAGKNMKSDFSISDDQLRILAWVYTDGCFHNDGKSITIYQRKSNHHIIKELLERSNIKFTLSNRERNITEICGKKLKKKPEDEYSFYLGKESLTQLEWFRFFNNKEDIQFLKKLSSRQFEVFLREATLGDGTIRDHFINCGVLYGTYERISNLQIICAVNNVRTSLYEYRDKQARLNITFDCNKTQIRYLKTFSNHIENELVWCLKVKNENFLVRRNGKVWFSGNCYDAIAEPEFAPYFLGDYGLLPGSDGKVFFVRGAWSIDKAYRREGISWWRNEELSYKEANDCLDYWEHNCSNVELVLSHDAPINVACSILKQYPVETTTGILLYEMLKIHEPKQWFHGHYHVQWQKKMGNTQFRCLDINQSENIEV
jgi:hypothetical protein